MVVQKQAVVELVQRHRGQGRTVGEVLGSVGVTRSSYLPVEEERGSKEGRAAKCV